MIYAVDVKLYYTLDLKDIYKIDEECVKYSKASVVGVIANEYFKD